MYFSLKNSNKAVPGRVWLAAGHKKMMILAIQAIVFYHRYLVHLVALYEDDILPYHDE
jgi:hypothetical protein